MGDEVKSNIEGLELYSDNYPFRLPLRIRNFENATDYSRFIKNCEMVIRRSMEYKLWVSYIKDVLQSNCCVITEERMDEVTVEVHHHIPSLFILVKALINKRIEGEEEFSTFDIAMDVIELHFANRVGYAVLLKSMHEKFHNGFLHIPTEMIRGDYRHFIDYYTRYLDDEDMETIERRLAIGESNISWRRNQYSSISAGG